MRKNDLIKALQEMKGNPEVLFWNPMVSDWMNIWISEHELSKQTLEAYLLLCLHQRRQELKNKDFEFPPEEVEHLKKLYKKVCEWESNEFVDRNSKLFGKKLRDWKKVLFIEAKPRNKTTWDRLGTIGY
jgi:hypothetical protein